MLAQVLVNTQNDLKETTDQKYLKIFNEAIPYRKMNSDTLEKLAK